MTHARIIWLLAIAILQAAPAVDAVAGHSGFPVILPGAPIAYTRPWLTPKQTSIIFAPERLVCCEASTKSGKTHGCICWLFEEAINPAIPYANFWWVAPVYPVARIAWERMKNAIPASLRTPRESDLTILLANNHRIWFKSAEKPDNLFGEDVGAAVLDEASRMREAAMHAVRTTLTATKGRWRVIGNVKGRKNWFYHMARSVEAGRPNSKYGKMTYIDAVRDGILDQEEIDSARLDVPESVFKELYLAEASEDGSNPFGLSHIKAAVAPMSTEAVTVYGVDLAKSVDFTVQIGLDSGGVTAAYDRYQNPWRETKARILKQSGQIYSLLDSTGVGDPIVEDLQHDRPGVFHGFKFTSESKQRIMEGLALAVQTGRVKFPDGAIRAEMDTFEYQHTRTGVRYSAPEGMHDDTVCALALAVEAQRQRRANAWGPA